MRDRAKQNGGSVHEQDDHAHPLEDHELYQSPDLECDVVMKGGITSGVVYPHAICELAKRFKLRSIGGTSAGAIAAACAAAAELGRGSPEGGFARLASLPRRLGEPVRGKVRRLESLFQPHPGARALFDLIGAATVRRSGKLIRLAWASLRAGGVWTAAGTVVGLLLAAVVALPWGAMDRLGFLCFVTLPLIGAVAGAVLGVRRVLTRHVPSEFFGLCTGMRHGKDGPPALTEWLHRELQLLAGRGPKGPPLTFEDLQKQQIALQVITTCITHGGPYGLPGLRRTLYFDPDEFRRLFPPEVVDYLVCLGRETVERQRDLVRKSGSGVGSRSARLATFLEHACMHPRLPLPRDGALPVIVAVRMSLSFPLLVSAVPLWDYDWGGNGVEPESPAQASRAEFRAWARAYPSELASLLADPTQLPDRTRRLQPERIWFSDGGITSNFPIHLFDAPIPRRPTVSLNLAYHEPKRTLRRDRRVSLVETNSDGIDEVWERLGISAPSDLGTVPRFFTCMLHTMQNWTDASLLKLPGYRDRFATIHLEAGEGGLNLRMEQETIRALSVYGRVAGRRLRERFSKVEGVASELSWTSHRWTRLRSSLDALQEFLGKVKGGLDGGESPSYQDLVRRDSKAYPSSYPLRQNQRDLVLRVLDELLDLNKLIGQHVLGLRGKAPRPRPEMRMNPRTNHPEA